MKPEQVILERIDKEMDDFIDRVFFLSQENLVRLHDKQFKSGVRKKVITTDTGNLKKTANVNRQFLDKEIVYPAPYASDVEFGNGGKNVKAESLVKWVRRKLFKGRGSERQIFKTAEDIARGLKRRGQSADPYLLPAFEQAKTEFKVE